MIEIIQVDEPVDPLVRDKYRRILDNVIQYFKDHGNVSIVKVVKECRMDAQLLSSGCKRYLKPSHGLQIFIKDREVFFKRV